MGELRSVIFSLIFFGIPVLNFVWWWLADRRVRALPHARWWRLAIAAFMTFQIGYFVWLLYSRATGQHDTGIAMVRATAYLWHLIILPLTMLVVAIGAVLRLAMRLIRRASVRMRRQSVQSDPPNALSDESALFTRREMLTASLAVAPILLTGASVARAAFQLDDLRVRRIPVELPDLPETLDGLRIAVVSDIHAGRFTRGDTLKRIAEITNELNADFVALPGDLIDFSLDALPEAVDAVRSIEQHHGIWLCEGNHDLFESRRGFEQGVREAGLNLLLNEAGVIELRGQKVQVLGLGLGDPSESELRSRGAALAANMAKLAELRDRDAFQILLAHHPHAFDLAAEAGIPLTLSGHTHGGQLMLTPDVGAGPVMFKYWSGLYRQGQSALVVSNGAGNWFPLRTSAPAEIVVVELRRAYSSAINPAL